MEFAFLFSRRGGGFADDEAALHPGLNGRVFSTLSLKPLVDPTAQLQSYEAENKNAQRLALMEEFKSMPFSAVWDKLCEKAGVPVGAAWLSEMESYEAEVLAVRS